MHSESDPDENGRAADLPAAHDDEHAHPRTPPAIWQLYDQGISAVGCGIPIAVIAGGWAWLGLGIMVITILGMAMAHDRGKKPKRRRRLRSAPKPTARRDLQRAAGACSTRQPEHNEAAPAEAPDGEPGECDRL